MKKRKAGLHEDTKNLRLEQLASLYETDYGLSETCRAGGAELVALLCNYDKALRQIDLALDRSQPHAYTGKLRLAWWIISGEIQPVLIQWIDNTLEYRKPAAKGDAAEGTSYRTTTQRRSKEGRKRIKSSVEEGKSRRWRAVRVPLTNAVRLVRFTNRNGWTRTETVALVEMAVDLLKGRAQIRQRFSDFRRSVTLLRQTHSAKLIRMEAETERLLGSVNQVLAGQQSAHEATLGLALQTSSDYHKALQDKLEAATAPAPKDDKPASPTAPDPLPWEEPLPDIEPV